MAELLIVLFFISLVVLAIGIYKPHSLKLHSRKIAASILLPVVTILLLVVLFVI